MTKTTAILPAYNEEMRIRQVIEEVKSYVSEVLVIDDCSRDATASVARSAGARVYSRTVNGGYIAAIKSGFQEARNGICVLIDADGEFDPAEIPLLVAPILKGEADMVQGCRPRAVRFSENLISQFAGLFADVGDSGTGFRALSTDFAKQLDISGYCICGILSLEIVSLGGRVVDVPVSLKKTGEKRRVMWLHWIQIMPILKLVFSHKLFLQRGA